MRKAFTLIELLVVIAIIALLISILVPSIARAKAIAKSLKCGTNLRAIAGAAYLYGQDNNDFVLRDYSHPKDDPVLYAGHSFWAAAYAKYLGISGVDRLESDPAFPQTGNCDAYQAYVANGLANNEIFRCPAVTDNRFCVHYTDNAVDFEKFVVAQPDAGTSWNPAGPTRVDRFPGTPTQTLFFVDSNIAGLQLAGNLQQFDQNDAWRQTSMPFPVTTAAPPKTPSIIQPGDDRHLKKGNIAFLDAHVEARDLTAGSFPLSLLNPLYPQ